MTTTQTITNVEQLLPLEGHEFIVSCYMALLDRTPDSNGLEHYTNILKKHGKQRVIADIANTRHESVRQITGLESILKRKEKSILGFLSHRTSKQSTHHVNESPETVASIEAVQPVPSKTISPPNPIDRITRFDLTPVRSIVPDARHQYRAIDNDPQFRTSNQYCFSSGWYRLTLRLYLSNGFGVFEVFPSGHPIGRFTAPVRSNTTHVFFIFLTEPNDYIRVDPVDRPCGFDIIQFDLIRLSNTPTAENFNDSLHSIPQLYKFPESDQSDNECIDTQIASAIYFQKLQKSANYLYEQFAYIRWIEFVERPWRKKTETAAISKNRLAGKETPIISIVMPVFNTPKNYLSLAIESVIAQSYPYFELCIVDDNSSVDHTKTTISHYAAKDDRIKVTYRNENGHISRATNTGISMAQGKYVAFMDHDDILDEHALYSCIEAFDANPDAALVYSDEDFIDEFGNRNNPHFKSDWNPDLLTSHNYITHFAAVNREKLSNELYFDPICDGAQDYDFFLRVTSSIRPEQIVHIPRILYHWRAHPDSTASDGKAKSYTERAGALALKKFCEKKQISAEVLHLGENAFHLQRAIDKMTRPLVSIIIPNKDQSQLLKKCIDSIFLKTSYDRFEILIVENNSIDSATFTLYRDLKNKHSNISIIYSPLDFNWSRLNNVGAQESSGEILLFLNNDIEVVNGDWLNEIVAQCLRHEIGCVGALLLYPDFRIQHAGLILSLGGLAGVSHKMRDYSDPGYFRRATLTQNLSAVTGACLAVRREVFDAAGNFSEDFPIAFNDVDFCLKVRSLGLLNLYTPHAILIHHESVSRGYEITAEKQFRIHMEKLRMQKKWANQLRFDPYYNPNLTTDKEDFSLGDF